MSGNVVIALRSTFGYYLVECDEEDWQEIFNRYENEVEAELQGEDGSNITLDLCDCVKSAVVAPATADLSDFFSNFNQDGCELFERICYDVLGENAVSIETTFIDNVLKLLGEVQGYIVDTRPIALGTTRMIFTFNAKRFEVTMKYNDGNPSYTFSENGDQNVVLEEDYVSHMKRILSEVPEPKDVSQPSEVGHTLAAAEETDLSAFDAAFGN